MIGPLPFTKPTAGEVARSRSHRRYSGEPLFVARRTADWNERPSTSKSMGGEASTVSKLILIDPTIGAERERQNTTTQTMYPCQARESDGQFYRIRKSCRKSLG